MTICIFKLRLVIPLINKQLYVISYILWTATNLCSQLHQNNILWVFVFALTLQHYHHRPVSATHFANTVLLPTCAKGDRWVIMLSAASYPTGLLWIVWSVVDSVMIEKQIRCAKCVDHVIWLQNTHWIQRTTEWKQA